jgi:hypothetical protein
MKVLSASSCHLEVIVRTSREANAIHILLHISAISMALRTGMLLPSRMKNGNIIPMYQG